MKLFYSPSNSLKANATVEKDFLHKVSTRKQEPRHDCC